jgi:hypothetical protein
VELLVQITQLTLELQAARKAAPQPPVETPRPAVQRSITPEPKTEIEEPEVAPARLKPEPEPELPEPEAVAAQPEPAPSAPETAAVQPEPEAVPEQPKLEPAPVQAEPEPEPEQEEPAPSAPEPAAVQAEPEAVPEQLKPEPAPAQAEPEPACAATPVVEIASVAQIVAPVPQASVAVQRSAPAIPDETHEKARRFAKLLVEEIKLYNPAKLMEGRARGDLYIRLRDDIEKSRSAYQKRYGESVKDIDYFTQELLRILADNNPVVMGAGFPG